MPAAVPFTTSGAAADTSRSELFVLLKGTPIAANMRQPDVPALHIETLQLLRD
jgi:hypothetical protein